MCTGMCTGMSDDTLTSSAADAANDLEPLHQSMGENLEQILTEMSRLNMGL